MIADKLKELRARKGLTREAAAEKIGISARTLANYERGERIPQGEILSSIADFYGVSREELLLDSLRERENLDPQAETADDGGETPAAEKTSADMAEIADGGGEAALAKKKEKRRNLRAWVIALSVLALFLIVDLVLFFIENLPVENGDSALGILPDWRNLGIALLLLLSVAVTAFGIFLAVRTKRERPRRIFILALCLFVAGMVAAGILGGLLCKDSLFAKKGAQRGFAVYLRLDLQGDYHGNVTAQARNNFSFGPDTLQVRINLYYSENYTDSAEEMELVQTVFAEDLAMFEQIGLEAPAEEKGYWRAQAVYKTNGNGWQELQTKTLLFDERGIKA